MVMWSTLNERKSVGGNVKVELDLFNNRTKANLNDSRGGDTLDFPKKLIYLI